MALSAGDKLGPYEILALVGAGGMGEVYKARDTRLGRDVAIKISKEHFDERLEREAKSIAALNHVNICDLYDVGTNYLVMELIAGESPKGPLPVETTLEYARQIAQALEAAHEKGIVHRDLKPANIKITPEGVVKVLDFGLAKASATQAGNSEDSPTCTMATQVGIILGTAAYMSPEQARGKPVDKSSDIWGFGAVLYELLTGEKPFRGETVTDVLAAVVKERPDLTRVPLRFRRLIERCLEKDPKRRLRDIGDFELLLEEHQPPPRHKTILPWAIVAPAAIVVAILAVGWWRAATRANDRPLRPLIRFDVDLGQDASLGDETPVLSPDGTRIAYVSLGRLYTRRLDQLSPVELEGSQGASHPFFSPDARWIAFFAPGELKKTKVDGGPPVDVMHSGSTIFSSGDWSNEGIVAEITPPGGLFRIPPDGGAPSQLTALDRGRGEFRHAFPQILPGGKAVLFATGSNVEAVSIADHRRKIVSSGAAFARYLPTGNLAVLSHDTLFAVPFDLDRLETRGTPTPLFSQVFSTTGPFESLDFSTLPPEEGMAMYRSGGASEIGSVQLVDSSGNAQQVLTKPDAYGFPRFSPDGQRLALMLHSDLYVYDLRREIMTRLTFTGNAAETPVWTPDGRYIVFSAAGGEGMAWARADGGGTPQRLMQTVNFQFPGSFAVGGELLVYCEFLAGGFDLLTVPIQNKNGELRAGQPEVFLNSRFNERDPTFSPDGKWVAYSSDESGPYEVYVRSFPDRGAKAQISDGGGWHPTWSRHAKELFFHTPQHRLMVASFTANGGTFAAEKPRLWSNTRVAFGDINSRHYDVAPDGKHVVAVVPVNAGSFSDNHVTFLLNFFDELRRKVPTGK